MDNEIKKVVSHGGIYAFGNVIRNIASFIMLPIYTRFLTPSDYGMIELLSMMVDLTSILVGMQLSNAIFRYYCTAQTKEEANKVISTAIIIVVVLNSIGILSIVILSEYLALFMFDSAELSNYVIMFSITLLFGAMSEIPMIYIRAQQRPWLFLSISMLKLLLQVSLNVYFIVFKEMRVEGVIYSTLITLAIISLILGIYIITSVGLKFSKQQAKKLVSFSAPLILSTLGMFYIHYGDRYYIKIFSGLDEVGIYSLGYKFGFVLMMLVWSPFVSIWDSQKYQVYKSENAKEIFQKVFVLMNVLLCTMGLLISVYIEDLIKIMTNREFWEAHKIVPIITLSCIVVTWCQYANLGILLKKKTIQITYASLLSVIIITIGYLTLIPMYGSMGAAWATLIALSVRTLWIYLAAKKEYNMELPWKKIAYILQLAIGTYCITLVLPNGLIISILGKTLIVMLYFIALYYSPVLIKRDREVIKKLIRNPMSFVDVMKKEI